MRGLVDRGHNLTAWRLDNSDSSYLPLSSLVPERVVHCPTYTNPVRRITAKFTRSYYLALDRMRAFDAACQECAQEIEKGGFDLLFANSASAYHVPYILRHVRIPTVLYLQEPCRPMYEAMPILPWVAGVEENLEKAHLFSLKGLIFDYPRLQSVRLLARQEWLNVRACQRLLVNSYFSRESVSRAYGVDAAVCYLGIDTSLFRNLRLPRERFIVGLGSFDAIKGIDRALRAIALLPAPRPPLVWISNSGNEHYQHEMSSLARSLGVELHLRQAIEDGELVETLNRAALLLYASRLEPFGFAPLEANACGLPVVAVAEGGVRETIQHGVNGLLVDSDPVSMSNAVAHLLNNSSAARRLGENGAAHVLRTWNLDNSIDRLEENLRSVVAGESEDNLLATKSLMNTTPREVVTC